MNFIQNFANMFRVVVGSGHSQNDQGTDTSHTTRSNVLFGRVFKNFFSRRRRWSHRLRHGNGQTPTLSPDVVLEAERKLREGDRDESFAVYQEPGPLTQPVKTFLGYSPHKTQDFCTYRGRETLANEDRDESLAQSAQDAVDRLLEEDTFNAFAKLEISEVEEFTFRFDAPFHVVAPSTSENIEPPQKRQKRSVQDTEVDKRHETPGADQPSRSRRDLLHSTTSVSDPGKNVPAVTSELTQSALRLDVPRQISNLAPHKGCINQPCQQVSSSSPAQIGTSSSTPSTPANIRRARSSGPQGLNLPVSARTIARQATHVVTNPAASIGPPGSTAQNAIVIEDDTNRGIRPAQREVTSLFDRRPTAVSPFQSQGASPHSPVIIDDNEWTNQPLHTVSVNVRKPTRRSKKRNFSQLSIQSQADVFQPFIPPAPTPSPPRDHYSSRDQPYISFFNGHEIATFEAAEQCLRGKYYIKGGAKRLYPHLFLNHENLKLREAHASYWIFPLMVDGAIYNACTPYPGPVRVVLTRQFRWLNIIAHETPLYRRGSSKQEAQTQRALIGKPKGDFVIVR